MSLNNIEEISFCIHQNAPKIHCLTNPVTMQDVANLLLAAGGSAVMGQNEKEVAEITGFCQGIDCLFRHFSFFYHIALNISLFFQLDYFFVDGWGADFHPL